MDIHFLLPFPFRRHTIRVTLTGSSAIPTRTDLLPRMFRLIADAIEGVMNPVDVQEIVSRFLHWDVECIATFITGLFFGAAFGWWIFRDLRSQIQIQKAENQQLASTIRGLNVTGDQLRDDKYSLQQAMLDLAQVQSQIESSVESKPLATKLKKVRQELEDLGRRSESGDERKAANRKKLEEIMAGLSNINSNEEHNSGRINSPGAR